MSDEVGENIESALWSLAGNVETLAGQLEDLNTKLSKEPEEQRSLDDLIAMVKSWDRNWSGPAWKDVKDIGKLINQIVGSTIIYTEMNDYQTDACDSFLILCEKENKYLIVVFDAWHDEDPGWKYAPIGAKCYDLRLNS